MGLIEVSGLRQQGAFDCRDPLTAYLKIMRFKV